MADLKKLLEDKDLSKKGEMGARRAGFFAHATRISLGRCLCLCQGARLSLSSACWRRMAPRWTRRSRSSQSRFHLFLSCSHRLLVFARMLTSERADVDVVA